MEKMFSSNLPSLVVNEGEEFSYASRILKRGYKECAEGSSSPVGSRVVIGVEATLNVQHAWLR
jgi:hypothetical protein